MGIKVSHDGSFDLATGRNRKETSWKNKETLWSAFVEKLSETHYTAETHAEYMAAKKVRQDEIKDVGGFVGGYLTGGRRKSTNVMHRQLITLDLDFCNIDFWEDFTLVYGNAAVVYSTHKHSSQTPRLRLILPLNRPVRPDEYEAISRMIAGILNIELFDPTTFQPERLMYWPSTSKEADYAFHFQDGDWLDADEILATYVDWKDSSSWPVSEKVDKMIQRSISKQGDPLEKTGVVGAFCKTYSIQEAIEVYLADVYDACDIENRYSYKEGSTGAGLVVYDDKYAYSHHGTDPTSGKLCNAFDLVRIHKFGLRDEDVLEGTFGNKLPSFLAMLDFATSDTKVKKQISVEKFQDAGEDFKTVDYLGESEDVELNSDWTGELDVDRKGNFLSSIKNIVMVLKNSPSLANKFQFDEFESRMIITDKLPWRSNTKEMKDFTDDDEDCLAGYLESIKMPFAQIPKSLARIRNDCRVHPVRDYVKVQHWDKKERLETLLVDYLGAEDTEYTRAVTRKTIIAAVARIFKPGIKFDTMLVLVGIKGIGKSTIFSKLAGRWFSDTMGDIHDKSGMENLRGVWIMEVAELFGFKKADQDAIKRFLSSSEDMYRPAYGKQVVRYPRQCIMVGTTNKFDFVTEIDERRFLPIKTLFQAPTKDLFKDFTEYEIGQIWAEAYQYFRAGESIDLSVKVKEMAEKVRGLHSNLDEREGIIEGYLERLLPIDWDELGTLERRSYLGSEEYKLTGVESRKAVCVAEIWCEALGGLQKEMNSYNTKFIHDYLRKLEAWQPTNTNRRFKIYGTQKAYILKEKDVNELQKREH